MNKVYNRPGSRGHRNADNKGNSEIDSSGNPIAEKKETDATPDKRQSRGRVDAKGEGLPGGQAKERDSQREPARGRSEFRGQMNKPANLGHTVDRVARSAAKSK